MKTKHEYGNKSEVSELDEQIAEEVKFIHDNEKAIAAFLISQHHDVVPGHATPDEVQAEPPVEGELHTDFIDRRKAAITDRRNLAKNKSA